MDTPSLGGFAFSPDGGGRSPLESERVRGGERFGKSCCKEGNQKHLENNAAARRPFPHSVVSNFSHRVGYSSCIGPFSFPSQWLLPQHSTLNALWL